MPVQCVCSVRVRERGKEEEEEVERGDDAIAVVRTHHYDHRLCAGVEIIGDKGRLRRWIAKPLQMDAGNRNACAIDLYVVNNHKPGTR